MKLCARCPAEAVKGDSYCRSCRANLQRVWREKHRARLQEEGRLGRVAKGLALAGMLGGKCEGCGLPYSLERVGVFELHHRDPTEKEFGFGGAMTRSMESLVEEARKCVLLCANCHRMRHTDDATRRWYDRMGPEIERLAMEYQARIPSAP